MEKPYIKEIQAIEKKRWELLSLEIAILVFLTSAVIILSILDQKYLTLFFLGLLSVLFSVYIISKEKELKKLNLTLTEEQFKNIDERARSASLKEKLDETVILYRVGRVSSSQLNLQRKLDKILALAFKMEKADRASIMLPNEKAGRFILASSIGLEKDLAVLKPQKIGEGVAGSVYENKTPIILSGRVEGNRFKNFIQKTTEINSAIILPIKLKGKVIGILNLSYLKETGREFTERDIKILSLFTRYISRAIEQTQSQMKKQMVHD